MRTIPPRLQEHLNGSFTTTCRLLKITLTNEAVYGLTTLDIDVVYQGVTYSSLQGFDPSVIASDLGLSVDNGEVNSLLRANMEGITAQMALSGDLDDAIWEMYLINYMDHSMGHTVLDAGDIGEVTVVNGIVFIPELLSFAMRLRQTLGTTWSRRCRATFGDPPNTQLGCGVNTAAMWRIGAVSSIGEDPFRVFADIGNLHAENLVPGRLRWTTGPNRSSKRLHQVEAYSNVSGTIVLMEPLVFAASVGDRYEIRRDCNKSPSHCIAYKNIINYKGEPFIPTGDGLETMTPSAQTFGGLSGSAVED